MSETECGNSGLGTYPSKSKTIINTRERNWLLQEWALPPLRLEGAWVNVCGSKAKRKWGGGLCFLISFVLLRSEITAAKKKCFYVHDWLVSHTNFWEILNNKCFTIMCWICLASLSIYHANMLSVTPHTGISTILIHYVTINVENIPQLLVDVIYSSCFIC